MNTSVTALFIVLSLCVGWAAEPSPALASASAPSSPLVFNALNYTQQPDLRSHKLAEVVMVYESELYPDLPDRKDHHYPTAAGWAKFDARIAAAPPGVPVCLDLELASHPGYPWTKQEE